MNLDIILDICLQRLDAGETIESCLTRYPDHADALAPMLAAARTVGALREECLPESERLRTKALIRATMAARGETPGWWQFGSLFGSGRAVALAGLAVAFLFVVTTATAVIGSQPGEFPYQLRVLAERTALLIHGAPENRASASLDFSERRLADLSTELSANGRADFVALDALLQGMEGAARTANDLTDENRQAVAGRLKAQADKLRQMALAAEDSLSAPALREAADRADALADGVGVDSPSAQGSPAPELPETGATRETERPRTAVPEPVKDTHAPAPTRVSPTATRRSATARPLPTTPVPTPQAAPTKTPTVASRPTLPPLLATDMAVRGEPTVAAGENVRTPGVVTKPTQALPTPTPLPGAIQLPMTAAPTATSAPKTAVPGNTRTVPAATNTPLAAVPTAAAVEPFPATPAVKPGKRITPVVLQPTPTSRPVLPLPPEATAAPSPLPDDPLPDEPSPGQEDPPKEENPPPTAASPGDNARDPALTRAR